MTVMSPTTSQPDGALLLYCLGVRRNGETNRGSPKLTLPAYTEILRQADENGITPLLYHRLTTVVPEAELPRPVMNHLRDAAVRSAARALQITRELAAILKLFRRHGIAVIVLKGAHLAQLVYESRALRTMGDLDLMVRRDQLSLAEHALEELGYRPQHDPLDETDYTRHHHTRPLGKPGAVRIDLHWNIARPAGIFDVDLDGIWARAVPAQVAGVDALVLSHEDLILHLCVHASFHHQFRLGLRACWDILEVLRRHGNSIDWDILARRAQHWRIDRYVYVVLRLVQELLGVDIPAAAMGSMKPEHFPPAILAWAGRRILTIEDRGSLSPAVGKLWTSRRLKAKLGVLLESICPPRIEIARTYGIPPDSKSIYLWYPLRWVGLLVRYGPHAWGVWRGDPRRLSQLRAASEFAALSDWLDNVDCGSSAPESRRL
jgi:hypothetical protein